MTLRTGSCLCGARAYAIDGEIDGVWICHCSLCRKASGSAGNAILIVPKTRFRWVKGADHGVTFALRETYAITRCKTCGTPLPAEEDADNVYLTAGTLDTPLGRGVRTHIFCASRAVATNPTPAGSTSARPVPPDPFPMRAKAAA